MSDTEKPALRPANENPWYCLATLHGEQPIDGLDQGLADKNYIAWNRWMATDPSEVQLHADYASNFARRTSLKLPEPGANPDFSHTHFDGKVIFTHFQFPRPTDFRSAMFSGEANFSRAQLLDVDFSSATFSADANFLGTQFNNRVDFQSATFSNMANFQYVNFADPNFRFVTFSDIAEFSHAKFSGRADFLSASFSGVANFDSAEFLGDADFNSTIFSEATYFRLATFLDEADFSEANFSSYIYFRNAKFNGYTIFADARFVSWVPDFRGATMHEATEWHGVTWPKPPGSKKDAQQQVYAYERLKQEMERLKKHEDEQSFFRRELRARRGLVRALSGGWLLNLVYQVSSDYGNSINRPLLWLFGVFAAGTAIFARAPLYCGAPMPIKLAAGLSFANIFVFLPAKREIMTDTMVGCLASMAQVVGVVQSLLGVVLLFLLGLALRNRFRMK